ncbi:MAG: hypothetical protein HYT08_00185 [Candidatus Levybacteria bacterium]|nr:hypothetical protein [Candidatus Levybacteria bacterium]
MNTKSQNKQKKTFVDQNPIESFKGIGQAVLSSTVKDLGKDAVSDLWKQLLGGGEDKSQNERFGDLSEGEEIELKAFKKRKDKSSFEEIEPAIDYRREILQRETQVTLENTRILKTKIEEILSELKQIAKASQEIAAEFKEITVEQRIEKPGDYHLNFFQWMLSVVKSARMKIEDSGAWLSVMKSRKNKKNYWTMFAKHGTTFGLSNERVVATQTG